VLTDAEILSLPIEIIQEKGFVFLWTTNSKRSLCETLLKGRGYRIATYVEWFKVDPNNDEL